MLGAAAIGSGEGTGNRSVVTTSAIQSVPLARSADDPATRTIQIASGRGMGPTGLAAFDAALRDAGVANFNLVVLSSVIPTGSSIAETNRIELPHTAWGDGLYVVLAQERAETPHVEAWAGLGWRQEEASGKGIFVEHHGASEAKVRRDIADSLEAIVGSRIGTFGPSRMKVCGISCENEPVCAIAVAAYRSFPVHG
jgi:arginine decarboxylase